MRNALFGVLRVLVIAPVPLLLTPFILKHIGTAGFGVWSVFVALYALSSLADLGFVGTLSRHVADQFARREFEELNRTVITGAALFLVVASCVSALLWLAAPWIVSSLGHAAMPALSALVRDFRWFVVAIACNLLMIPLSSIATGMQRMDITNIASAVTVTGSAIAGAIFLGLGYGLSGLIYGYIAGSAISLLLLSWMVRGLLPVSLALNGLSLKTAKQLLSFSSRMYMTQVASAICYNFEKLVLARFTGVVYAGYYEIGNDLALKLRAGPALLLSPLLAASAELNAVGDGRALSQLYFRAHKYLALLIVPAALAAIAFSRQFVSVWLGNGYGYVAPTLAALTAIHLFNLSSGPALMILIGVGELGPAMRSAILGITLNVGLSLPLILIYGYWGAVFGTGVSLTVAPAYLIWAFHRKIDISWWQVFRGAYLKPFLCSLITVAATLLISRSLPLSRASLLLLCLAFGPCYLALLAVTRFFDRFDLEKIERIFTLPKLFRGMFRHETDAVSMFLGSDFQTK